MQFFLFKSIQISLPLQRFKIIHKMEEIAKIKNTKPHIFKIGVYSLGHLVNDLYMNQIQVLIPFGLLED